jgi:hypothetical protein
MSLPKSHKIETKLKDWAFLAQSQSIKEQAALLDLACFWICLNRKTELKTCQIRPLHVQIRVLQDLICPLPHEL